MACIGPANGISCILVVQSLGDTEEDPGPRPGLWKKVLGVMRLTPEQRMDLLEHRKVLLSQLTEVGRQRHEIIAALQASDGFTNLATISLCKGFLAVPLTNCYELFSVKRSRGD